LKAFLLGAGASRGTFAFDAFPVPVAREFGKTLAALDPCWKQNYPALLKTIEHLRLEPAEWPLEPVWTCIDYYAKLQPVLPLQEPWEDASGQIKKALLLVYGGRCDKEAGQADDNSTIADLFRSKLQAGDILISFNYDTITERVAQKCGHQLAGAPHSRSESVMLAKPHGSTSWIIDLKSHSVTWKSPDGSPLVQSLTASDVDCRREPLLLGAVPIKSELIREVQESCGVPGVFDAISVQWRAVVEAVRDAEAIFVVGYSFPPEDQYGRFLVKEGLRLRTGKKLKIELFEAENKAAERAREIVSVFGDWVQDLVFRGPVKPRIA
jgi:hypothetical protein